MVDNPFAPAKPDGKLTLERWRTINKLLDRSVEHDELLYDFTHACGLSQHRIKAELETYRLASPRMLQ